MDIIQQVIEIITREHYSILEETLRNKGDIGDFVLKTKEMLDVVGTKLVKDALEVVDDSIRNSKERKEGWYIERRSQEKTLSTVFGDVTYERTYYKKKSTGEYAYLSDERLGIEVHDRMDMSLKAAIVEKASDMSYEKAGKTFKSTISSTSVMNAIREMDKIDNCYLKSKTAGKKIPVLYVEADEDHVATQRSGGQIVKIAYVHEGRKELAKGRYELVNPRYFTALQGTSEDFWLDVANYICEAYDTESISKIYLSGDGARWIKEGLNWIPKSVFVLDTFHLAKYVNKATAHALYTRNYLWKYIWSNMKDDVKKLLKCNIDNAESEAKKKDVMEAKTYILNHWDAIQHIKNDDYHGCSAEGHVSHILSDRMSSRPMGWSIEGADEMARLRVFCKNGGKIYDYMKNEKKSAVDRARIEKLDLKVIKNRKKSSYEKLDNLIILTNGKKTWESKLLRSIRGL